MTKKPNYEPELKQKILRLHLEEGRTQKSLTKEYVDCTEFAGHV